MLMCLILCTFALLCLVEYYGVGVITVFIARTSETMCCPHAYNQEWHVCSSLLC